MKRTTTQRYREALQSLYASVDYEKVSPKRYSVKAYDLARFNRLLSRLGDPHLRIKTILVAGTKGKGSTAAMMASILQAAGYKTGLYTSPHLVSVRERIRIGGSPISRSDFCRAIGAVARARDGAPAGDYQTVFEALTAAAFLHFERKRVDIAVCEVGMGGRLDATNVLNPLISVITPISLDHCDILGRTVRRIAQEKAGIIREGCVTVVSGQPGPALSVIRDDCARKGSRMVEVDDLFSSERIRFTQAGTSFDVTGRGGVFRDVGIPLLGRHQVGNALTALTAVARLRDTYNYHIPDEAVYDGFRAVSWPGRMEVVRKKPFVVLDGAHNVSSARALLQSLREIFSYRQLLLVLGISANKDIPGIVRELAPYASRIVLTKADPSRGAEPPVLRKQCKKYSPAGIVVSRDPRSALRAALALANPYDLVCATGSLYLVGALKRRVT